MERAGFLILLFGVLAVIDHWISPDAQTAMWMTLLFGGS